MRSSVPVLIVLIAVFSCASRYRPPESFEAKIRRYKAKRTSYSMPHLEMAPIHFKPQKRRQSRALASVSASAAQKKMRHISGKNIYFANLLEQYYSLARYTTGHFGMINICPSFNALALEYKNKKILNRKVTLNVEGKYQDFSKKSIAHYPELALPLSLTKDKPTVAEIARDEKKLKRHGGINSLVKKALHIHLSKIHSEIGELCYFGSSDNYYAYANLTTYIRRNSHDFQPSKKNMHYLLKTSLFINKALLQSLGEPSRRGRKISSINDKKSPYFSTLLKHMDVVWSGQYFSR